MEAECSDDTNIHSAEGTAAHQIRSECLLLNLDPYEMLGHRVKVSTWTFTVTREMANNLQPGIDQVREMPGKLFVEHRVSLDRWLPGQFGTLDVGVAGKHVININDLKYGTKAVDVEYNKQLMLYAIGFYDTVAWKLTRAERFILSIDQPRVANKGGDPWEISLDDLFEFGKQARKAAKATLEEDAPCRAGEHCDNYYCKAREICKVYQDFKYDLVKDAFRYYESVEKFDPAPIDELTMERRIWIARHHDQAKKWLDQIHASVLSDALAGVPTPGVKAVLGRRGNRVWSDQEKAEDLLRKYLSIEEIFTKSLIGPATAEKLVLAPQWESLKALITQSEAKPTLVPESDKRQPIESMADRFKRGE